MPPRRIEFSSADISEDERALVNRVITSQRLSCGPILDELERAFAARFGAREAVGVSSGTAGLHLSMIAADVADGDVAITTPLSFVATSNAVLYERGVPLFVDIDPNTLLIDIDRVLEVIDDFRVGRRRERLRAVIPVHLFGRMLDLTSVVRAAREAGAVVVEDACEAIGAVRGDVYAGRAGQLGVFGFYPNKQITMGEGGMVLTDDAGIAAHMRCLRSQGRDGEGTLKVVDRPGYNYRLDELSAALGLAQLRRLDVILAERDRVAGLYALRLADSAVTPALPHVEPGLSVSWFVYQVRLPDGVDRALVRSALAERGIPTRVYFDPIHLHPFYRRTFGHKPGDFPHAEAAGRSLLALPFHTKLTIDEIDYICSSLEDCLERAALSDRRARA